MLRVYVAFALFVGINSEFDPGQHENWGRLPHDSCGKISTFRVVGGIASPMSAFPWIVRVGISSESGVRFTCAGVLISSDTVLTAAHCIPGRLGDKTGVIRLGEYNTETNPDCESDFCADPVLDVPVSKFITPIIDEEIDSVIDSDIAIIKLAESITFTEFVMPICIGGKDFMDQNFVGRMSEVAGWGYTNIEDKRASKVLEVVQLPILPHDTCIEHYKYRFRISTPHFCAGGEPGMDACNGDSGGPIMIVDDAENGPRYYLLGIVSFGPVHCGNPHYPGIYTNLTTFLPWILNNFEGTGSDATVTVL